jgi:hypothetical protein
LISDSVARQVQRLQFRRVRKDFGDRQGHGSALHTGRDR